MSGCRLCPRLCNTDRAKTPGYCGGTDEIRVARIGLHEWEEPCLSYGKGSGTIFFSGCSLKCVYCQNHEISVGLKGKNISVEKLSEEILNLQDIGAVNINLVTPTHFADKIAAALDKTKHKLKIPVCYNSSGYENIETIKALNGYIDIFLPDIKYFSKEYSLKYSGAGDYFDKASQSLLQMHSQCGYAEFDGEGRMKSGVLVRHLVLPSLWKDSIEILKYLNSNYDVKRLALSIMNQYFPTAKSKQYPEINRRLTTLEYSKVIEYAKALGFEKGYIQDRSSAKEDYVPEFDY